jgi:ABC-type transport system involved in multi-copper enzyme maturation permease subunit
VKFREIVRYELEHRLRSVSTWIYAAVLFGLAFLMMSGGGTPSEGVDANAPTQLALISLILGIFGLVVSAALFSDAAVRDVASEMDPLLYTSPLSKAEYLGGRYVAALATNAVVLLGIPIGLATPQLLGLGDPAATFGPFRVAAYLQPWLLLLLPNLVFTGAVLFTLGVLARQVVAVFMGTIGLFMITMFTLGPGGEGVHPVASVLGPLGLHALNELTEYWTAAERNTRLIGLSTNLMWNRVVWLTFAAAVLAVLHRSFRFAHRDGGRRRRDRRRSIVETVERPTPVAVPRPTGAFGIGTTARQTFAVAHNSLTEVVASRWFIVVLLACVVVTAIWGSSVGSSVFDTSTWPVTLLVAGTVLTTQIIRLVYVLIAVYAGELVWKDRETGAAEIADAAPVPDGVALLGRFLALVATLVLIQAATLIGGLLIQASQGYFNFELGLYLRVVFGLNLATYVLIAALAMTVHVLVNHKVVGHMVVLLAMVFTHFAGRFGVRGHLHHLLIYGTDPGWTYSDMNGFGPFVEPFVWFKLYWAAWALLLGVVAAAFWVRGRESGLRHRLREARARFTGPLVRTAGVASLLVLIFGGFIFYNTNILNEYRNQNDLGAPLAAYEARYRRYESVPQPTLRDVQLRVEIYPDEPAVDLRGSYRLENRSDEAMDSVHVYLSRDIEARSLSWDRPAELVLADEEVGYRIFTLERPLAPGDSLSLAFDVTFRPRGFPNSGIQTHVVDNGAHFNRSWLPFIGYQPMFELRDDETRQRFELAPRPPLPAPHDTAAARYRSNTGGEGLVDVDATIGTAADQIAITPGVLRRSWTENGRRYFHYQTETPIEFGGIVFSGMYAVLDDRWNDVALQIFHHPTHDYNLDRMVHGMKASLDYFTAQFGPYPDRQLRIVEFPRYGGFGHAHPHTIAFAEDAFLSRVREGEVDQPFYGTAHEVAHQWWGGMVQGAPVGGHGFLSESLANYSAMMVTEKAYGPEVARRVYNFHLELYLRGRATQSREVPVLEVTDQPYIAYRKGAIALYALRERIGEVAVNTALRSYFEQHSGAGRQRPTSLDLYAELRAVAPDSLQYLLTDWFETITLWDVSTERAVMEPTGTGAYVVTLDVVARKMRADSVGNETEVPMDDFVEIGVFTGGAPINTDLNLDFDEHGDVLYLERHRIRTGRQTLSITVPQRPVRAGIDPYRKLIDRRGGDNVIGVDAAVADPSGSGP